MKPQVLRVVACVTCLGLTNCVASTIINTRPDGANLFVDGVPVGTTPYTLADTKVIGSSTSLRMEKDGYEPFDAIIARSEEIDPAPAIVGFFFCLIPLLWAMKYRPEHYYTLRPAAQQPAAPAPGVGQGALR